MKSIDQTLPLLIPTDIERKQFELASNFELSLTKGSAKKAMENAKSADLWKCPLDEIVIIERFNVRGSGPDFDADVRRYADSMKVNGFYPSKALAIIVFKDENGVNRNGLYDGHRRYAAAKLARSEGADIQWAPCVTAPEGTSMEDLTVALVTMNEGKPLQPLEIAAVCKRLVNFGMEIPEISNKIGKTPTYIKGLLDLMGSSRAVQTMVSEGTVSATLAITTVQKHGAEAAKVLVAGKEKAKAQGKERVTAKTLKPAADKLPKADKVVKAEKPVKRDLLQVATDWLARNADIASTDKRVFELAGLLCEVSADEVEGRVQFKMKEVTPESALAAANKAEVQLDLAPEVLN